MSLTAKESPKWEAKTRPKTTGVREYGVELSKEVFWKLLVIVRGKNAARPDDPDRMTVSGQAETILRTYLDTNYPTLSSYWDQHIDAEEKAIDFVKDTQAP